MWRDVHGDSSEAYGEAFSGVCSLSNTTNAVLTREVQAYDLVDRCSWLVKGLYICSFSCKLGNERLTTYVQYVNTQPHYGLHTASNCLLTRGFAISYFYLLITILRSTGK